ncbi:hypothetical protein PIB30_056178 [Stylosanthes scabra]|uniref:Uncharacterized protein n=1 Tax=Stylosanthes scabra TaxID=79078 RepID=A0ABU6SJ69_9FABA|nr:hypothetical protein [Stylosanthes scabra]
MTMGIRGVKIPHSAGIPTENVPNEDSKAENFPRGDRDEGQIPPRQWRGPEGRIRSPVLESPREWRIREKKKIRRK